jgi:hypothetical protein
MDLVLPAAVPVADLLPELARAVGLLDVATVPGGHRLVLRDGRVLATGSALGVQGVEDGAVLTVATGEARTPRVHDDPAEAMGDAVAREVVAWDRASVPGTMLRVAAVLLLLGVCCAAVRHGDEAGLVCLPTAGVLIATAILVSRVARDCNAAVTCAVLGCAYAVASAAAVSSSPAAALVTGGAALLAAGLGSCLGLAEGRVLLLAPVLVGATILGAGLVVRLTGCDPTVVLTVVLVVVVLGGQGLPGPALRLAQVRGRHAVSAVRVDEAQIAADARIAHQLVIAASVAAGAIVVLFAPAAVSLGVAGTLTALLACVLLLLRSGRQRARRLVEIDLGAGVLGLVATILGTARFHPHWPFAVTGALLLTGLVVTRLALATTGSGAHRLAVAAEAVCVVTIVPVLTLTAGLLSPATG